MKEPGRREIEDFTMSEIFFENSEITVRIMKPADVAVLAEEEIRQGWGDTAPKHNIRINDMYEGSSITLVAVYNGLVSGYVSVYYKYEDVDGTFYPGIVDFSVLEKCRNRGIGKILMDTAEEIAFKFGNRIYLGVGLCESYGSAQRMYIKRGYIPNGKGAYYDGKIAERGKVYPNDDSFYIKLYKDAPDI